MMKRSPRYLILPLLLAGGAGADGGDGSGAGGGASTESPVTTTCEPDQVKLSYDGAADQSYEINGWPSLYAHDMGTANRIFGRLGLGWYELVFEPELDEANPGMPLVIRDTKPWPVRTALLADATDQNLGPIRCVTPGSGSTLSRKDQDLLLDLKAVDVIQTCRDNPVDGQINLCFQFGGCDLAFDGGSVGGTPWVLQPDTWVGGGGMWQIELGEGSIIRAATTISVTGPAYWALIVTSPSSAYGGAIYCASGGTVEETAGDFGYTIIRLTDLGTVTCGAGTSTARGCLQGG